MKFWNWFKRWLRRSASPNQPIAPPSPSCPPNLAGVERLAWSEIVSQPLEGDDTWQRVVGWHQGRIPGFGSSGLPERSRRRMLRDRVALAPLFLGFREARWSDTEIRTVLNGLERSADWLIAQASAYRVPLRIAIIRDILTFHDPLPAPEEWDLIADVDPEELFIDHFEPIYIQSLNRALAEFQIPHFPALHEALSSALGSTISSLVWIVVIRQSGRSMACRLERTMGWPGLDVVFHFPRYSDWPRPLWPSPQRQPDTLAHEILHVFGATDKYQTPLSRFRPDLVEVDDIMRMEFNRMADLRVGRLTAHEVGWI